MSTTIAATARQLGDAYGTMSDTETLALRGMSRIHVAALFNVIVRLADSLGWDVPEFEEFHTRAEAMLTSGYALD